MRIAYTLLPAERRSPFGRSHYWLPIVQARLLAGGRSVRVESIIDSGSHCCLFHSDIAAYLGIETKSGRRDKVRGVVATEWSDVYYHPVALGIGTHRADTMVGFVDAPTSVALLGRIGFFENFSVTFDPVALCVEILPLSA